MRLTFITTICALAICGVANDAHGQIAANLVIKSGDSLGGSTVSTLNSPFTNGLGQVGFNAALADGSRSIWFNGGEIFNSVDALPDVLIGGESTMGFGNNAEFIYSPSFNGDDAVWNQNGLVLVEDTQAPGFPAGVNSTFHSRPQMTDDGTSYWVSGFNDGAGGTSSIGRMLYKQNPDTTFEVFLKAGDLIGGQTVSLGSGISFDYHFSGNNTHSIGEVNVDTGSTTDDSRLIVNKLVVAAEGSTTGQGDNWDNFDQVSINNSGNYLFSGDTDGATTSDEFIAYNGVIQLRQGDALAGGSLSGFVDAASLNNLGQAAFIWDLDATESLFFAFDASNLANAHVLASVGDLLDVDNDGMADWILTDFNASIGPGINLAENGLVYVEVDLESLDGSTNVEAIISFQTIPEPGTSGLLTLGAFAYGTFFARRRRRSDTI